MMTLLGIPLSAVTFFNLTKSYVVRFTMIKSFMAF